MIKVVFVLKIVLIIKKWNLLILKEKHSYQNFVFNDNYIISIFKNTKTIIKSIFTMKIKHKNL